MALRKWLESEEVHEKVPKQKLVSVMFEQVAEKDWLNRFSCEQQIRQWHLKCKMGIVQNVDSAEELINCVDSGMH